jgi:hypothetical protein
MAYPDEFRRGGDRDEEFRFGDENRGRGEFREAYGRGYEENRPGFGGTGRSRTGSRGFSESERYGQHRGYSEEGGYDPQRLQFRPGSSEGYRRYGESYGRGPEGFDRETGSYPGYSRGTTGFGQGTPGFEIGSGYSEPARFGETWGTPFRTPRGRFTGRGPKGYTRSDERILEDVSDRLEQHGEIDPSDIEVRVTSGEVTLEGTVENRWMKRMAEDLVEDCPGVRQVNNRIRIQGNGGERASTGQTGGTRGLGGSTGTKSIKS